MSGPAEGAVATGVLLDVALKSTLVWGAAGVVARALPSAAARHAVWAASFAAIPLLAALASGRGAEVAVDAPRVLPLWALGALGAAAPWAWGLVGLARLRRRLRVDAEGVAWTSEVGAPVTWGVLRPVVVLPEEARGWPSSWRHAALAHERAHVARRDWLLATLARGLCAGLWFHPLAWLALGALHRHAEHAADDVVLAEGALPSDYAALLLGLARGRAPTGALGAGSLVAARVRAVLGPRSRGAGKVAWGISILALAGWTAWLGVWSPWTAPEEALTCAPAELLP